jgi:serine/threonine-protein kinase
VAVETSILGGRYRIERLLGSGAMSTVVLAHDRKLERKVAVKLLAEGLLDDSEFRRRFLREGKSAARLAHPNVVRIYDVGEEDGRPYIVMQCVEGETLTELLRRHGRLPAGEVADLGTQAAAGLAHAHAAGLVHRDVKPRNLLLDADGTLRIADFGIARSADATHVTQVGTVLGTVGYLAPEQAAAEPVTGAADVYSLGVVLYELLTGRRPHEAATLAELVREQREGTIAPIRDLAPDVPDGLEDVLMRCLARNPSFRPSAGELATLLGGASPEATTRRLPAPRATRHRARRRLALPALFGMLALAALGFGLARAVDDGGSPRPRAVRVETVPAAQEPAEQARLLARWLREHAAPR